MSSDHGKDDNGLVRTEGGFKENSVRETLGRSSDLKEHSGVTTRATISDSLIIEKVPVATGRDGSINVEQSGYVKASTSLFPASNTSLSMRVFDKREGLDALPICLEARPRQHAANDIVGVGNTFMMKETEIVCTRGVSNSLV